MNALRRTRWSERRCARQRTHGCADVRSARDAAVDNVDHPIAFVASKRGRTRAECLRARGRRSEMKALVQMTVQQRESLTAQHSVERRRVSQAVVRHVRSAVSAKRRVMHHHQHRAMSHASIVDERGESVELCSPDFAIRKAREQRLLCRVKADHGNVVVLEMDERVRTNRAILGQIALEQITKVLLEAIALDRLGREGVVVSRNHGAGRTRSPDQPERGAGRAELVFHRVAGEVTADEEMVGPVTLEVADDLLDGEARVAIRLAATADSDLPHGRPAVPAETEPWDVAVALRNVEIGAVQEAHSPTGVGEQASQCR